jgi:DNA (cytosine-5)-methyltransferase 3A
MKNVLSLFDGISGMQIALDRAKIEHDQYYSSEIDNDAIKITQSHFPNTIQLGDVRNVKKLSDIWLLSAGSPCKNLSLMGNRKGMEATNYKQYLKLKERNYNFIGESHLFWEFIRLFKQIKPKYFLFENVKMSEYWENIITDELGVKPLEINSSLVSAQNRLRYYWTNIPGITIPRDKGIVLSDIIENAKGGHGKRGRGKKNEIYVRHETTRKDQKSNCVCTKIGATGFVKMNNGHVRRLNVSELEMLQTLPENYTNVSGITNDARIRCIGNGWTIDVIKHLLMPLKKEKKIWK